MSENILEKIIKKKIEKIDHLKKSINLDQLNDHININSSFINFNEKIPNNIQSLFSLKFIPFQKKYTVNTQKGN